MKPSTADKVISTLSQAIKGTTCAYLLGLAVACFASLVQTILYVLHEMFLAAQVQFGFLSDNRVIWFFASNIAVALVCFAALAVLGFVLFQIAKVGQEKGVILCVILVLVGTLAASFAVGTLGNPLFWEITGWLGSIIGLVLVVTTIVDRSKAKTNKSITAELAAATPIQQYSGTTPRRKVVVIIDGTNDFAAINPTHPYRLYQQLNEQNDPNMLVYYDGGVGTLRDDGRSNFSAQLGGLWDMAVGLSLGRNVKSAYEFLVDNYRDAQQDELMMFGFSRGAYAVRVLATVLYVYGLVGKAQRNLIPFIWQRAGTPNLNHDMETINALRKGVRGQLGIPIDYMGIWDTVDSIGFFRQQMFPFTASLPNVLNCRHAIALDEARNAFSQVPIKLGNGREEQWYPGVHRDVGGGDKNTKELSLYSYNWVLEPVFPTLQQLGADTNGEDGIKGSKLVTLGYGILGFLPMRMYSGKWNEYRWHYFKFNHIRKPKSVSQPSHSLCLKFANPNYKPVGEHINLKAKCPRAG